MPFAPARNSGPRKKLSRWLSARSLRDRIGNGGMRFDQRYLAPKPVQAQQWLPPDNPGFRICPNQRCKKGLNGTPGMVKSARAKYCCNYCRIDVCRRNRPKSEQTEKRERKRRKDAKYASHRERQRAYQARHSTADFPQGIKDLLCDEGQKA